MNKIILVVFFFLGSLYLHGSSDISLKGVSKTINISTNTVDIDDVISQTNNKIKMFDFNDLKNDKKAVQKHLNRIVLSQKNLKKLSNIRAEMELNFLDIKQLETAIENAKKQYDRNINRIYKKNKQIERYSYILVTSVGEKEYKKDLESFVIDKYAIKQYDQTTTLNKTLASVDMQSVIKTKKDFGQKTVDTIYEHMIRENQTTLKLFKVMQNPFVKTPISKNIDTNSRNNDQFIESEVMVYDLAAQDIGVLKETLQVKYNISFKDMDNFFTQVQKNINTDKQKESFTKNTQKINKVLNSLEKEHQKQSSNIVELNNKYNSKKQINKKIEPKLTQLLKETKKLLKPYGIPLTKETIGLVTIVSPKIYSETVQYKEEVEYINRKVKSYISKINISEVEQSDTLIDFEDLTSTTKNTHKAIRFETIHSLPFLDTNNKIGVLLFTSISIKDSLGEDDLLSFDFKYDTIKFIPVKKGYKTIFVAQKELTLGIVKEYLEKNRYKSSFDQYCIDDSFLPEDTKNFKNIDEEFYQYPAVCFKVDNIEKFTKWVSKKIKRDIVIPDASDWSYVASNSDTTDYCWGNATPDDLVDEERKPENIYIEGLDEEESTIQKVASYPKSKNGIYDMCGNVFELVMQDGELGYKGNSFSSYIETSQGEAEAYSDDVNSNLGLRLFYIKDLTNE
ncbi:MAG: SUMF1/EgtB/PvdO family nonheme iron enzyme [Campylobacterota bacterium]|nr:SUMF1/EgtB/PvdO family nonheme iron enzyme [Campylobacterota bacterium]